MTASIAWPTSVVMMEIKVDNQVAAPAETRNTQLAPSDKTSLTKSADGWVATVATRRGEKPCPIKKKMNPLDSDRPSHGRPLHVLTTGQRVISRFIAN